MSKWILEASEEQVDLLKTMAQNWYKEARDNATFNINYNEGVPYEQITDEMVDQSEEVLVIVGLIDNLEAMVESC